MRTITAPGTETTYKNAVLRLCESTVRPIKLEGTQASDTTQLIQFLRSQGHPCYLHNDRIVLQHLESYISITCYGLEWHSCK